ncbi:uncharacterized protein L201_000440 [Kwoniella dendrophila CBS 6074]|uniref:ferric-chelate reductase (NADPH) n=1 Tax=Kwoniella dendrophila CBS 6074 TaxID=1295534 RepID=A0AAX4JJG3_9TREE
MASSVHGVNETDDNSLSSFSRNFVKRTAWGGVDAEHPFEILSNPDEEPPLWVLWLSLGLFICFILTNLPKLLIRWKSNKLSGDLFSGIKLSSKPPSSSSSSSPTTRTGEISGQIVLAQTPITPSNSKSFDSPSTIKNVINGEVIIESPNYPSPTYQIAQTPSTATPLNAYSSPSSAQLLINKSNLPKHLPSLSSLIPYADSLEIRVPLIGYTFGQTILCIVGVGLTALSLFYENDNVNGKNRSGFVATNQLPICFLLAGKVNWIGYLVGKGYEKLNFLHRVASTIHAGAYFVKWMNKGGITYVSHASQTPFIMAGIVAWAAFAFIGLTSIPVIRRRMYGLFWISHWIGFITAIISLSFHKPYTGLFATICLFLYTKDLILRLLLKTRVVPAKIVALPYPSEDPSSGSTQIILPLKSGWKAGQHVFIRIPALQEKGGMSWLENHPFTISSTTELDGHMVLIVKKSGDWTRNLYDFASKGGFSQTQPKSRSKISSIPGRNDNSDNSSRIEIMRNEKINIDSQDEIDKLGYSTSEKRDITIHHLEKAEEIIGRGCKVLVEGPYGGPCSTVFSTCSGIMLMSGGSGITYSLSMFEDVIKKAEEGHLRATNLHFVWIVQTYEHALPLLGTIEELSSRALDTNLSAKMTVFITRSVDQQSVTHGNIRFITERPDLRALLHEAVAKTRSEILSNSADNCGLIVGVCGPRRLVDEINMAVRSVPWKESKVIGGVTVHNETFGW